MMDRALEMVETLAAQPELRGIASHEVNSGADINCLGRNLECGNAHLRTLRGDRGFVAARASISRASTTRTSFPVRGFRGSALIGTSSKAGGRTAPLLV